MSLPTENFNVKTFSPAYLDIPVKFLFLFVGRGDDNSARLVIYTVLTRSRELSSGKSRNPGYTVHCTADLSAKIN